MLYFDNRQAGARASRSGTSTLAGAVLMSLGGALVKSCDQDDGPAERPARKPAELRDGSHLAYLMDRARAGPLADRLRNEIAAGKFASMTELRAAEAERGTAYSSGVDQDVRLARGSRCAERDPHRRQQGNHSALFAPE